jgi:hypothetical protein
VQILDNGAMVAGDCFHANQSDLCNPGGGTVTGGLYGSGAVGIVAYNTGSVQVVQGSGWHLIEDGSCIAGVSCTLWFSSSNNPGVNAGDHFSISGSVDLNTTNSIVTSVTTGNHTFSGPWCAPNPVTGAYQVVIPWSGGNVTAGYCQGERSNITKITPWPSGHTLTLNYQTGGWLASGTGFMDEDGRPAHTWLGSGINADLVNGDAGANANFVSDMDAFLGALAATYFSNEQSTINAAFAVKGAAAPMYMGPDAFGTWSALPRLSVLQGASPYVGMVEMTAGAGAPLTQAMLNDLAIYLAKPIWGAQFLHANVDSPDQGNSMSGDYATQQAKGAAYYAGIQGFLSSTTTAGVNPFVGSLLQNYADTPSSENTNWGIVSLKDNAYDGHENVHGAVACSAPLDTECSGAQCIGSAYPCGGETYTWASGSTGDVLTSVKAANALWLSGGATSYALTTATTGMGAGSISGCAGSYAAGAFFSCTIIPVGSTISSVSGCGGSLAGYIYSGTMPGAPCTVTAQFDPAPLTSGTVLIGAGKGVFK